jgi:proteasome lid subunit RPN8/RPN11
MLAPFSKVVVDKKEERNFRRRALGHYPNEYIEALWGRIHGDTLYVVAFVRMEHKGHRRSIEYEDSELDEHEDDAREAGMSFLGTIHTHPNFSDTRFGDADLASAQESQELVMGILAIETSRDGKPLKRRRCRMAYWPVSRPLLTERREEYANGHRASFYAKKGSLRKHCCKPAKP